MGRDDRHLIAVVTVHGTGDTASDPDGQSDGSHWFQTRSKFVRLLKERLSGHGLDAEIVPHLWSGANSASDRERGAVALAKKVKRLAKKYHKGVHVIGHSHGGNVANDAATVLNWSAKQRQPSIASMTTVGTPFFRARASVSDRFGAWVFVLVVLLSLFMIPAVLILAGDSVTSAISDVINMPSKNTVVLPDHALEIDASGRTNVGPLIEWLGANAFPIASALALLFMLPVAFRGISRIARLSRRARSDPKLYSIWHPNDEAIAFLRRLEGLPIEPFPRWSLLRASRTAGLLWGVRAIILLNLAGALVLANDIVVRHVNMGAAPFQAYGTYLLLVGIAGAPLVFLVTYFLYRLFAAVVLEMSLRGMLNNTIGGALVAMAFGRDADHRIDKVATCSHCYGTRQEVIADPVASRMLESSAGASQNLFDKYRAALFSVDADEGNAINGLTKDSMTWDSLIHTTYFDQPEIADMIGDYIAGVAKGGEANARHP